MQVALAHHGVEWRQVLEVLAARRGAPGATEHCCDGSQPAWPTGPGMACSVQLSTANDEPLAGLGSSLEPAPFEHQQQGAPAGVVVHLAAGFRFIALQGDALKHLTFAVDFNEFQQWVCKAAEQQDQIRSAAPAQALLSRASVPIRAAAVLAWLQQLDRAAVVGPVAHQHSARLAGSS